MVSTRNAPFFGSLLKEEYHTMISCYELDNMATEDLLENRTILTDTVEIHVESADSSIIME